jgi:Ca2+:H+ antiporter
MTAPVLTAVTPKTLIAAGAGVSGSVATGVLVAAGVSPVIVFIVSAVTLAALAGLVGDATEQLGARLGAGATGILQSAVGNLPELLISIFALRAGLVLVVQTALIGSILANGLLVLGIAFVCGGLRHGTQRFATDTPRLIAVMSLLAVSAMLLPTAAQLLHAPASGHEETLSIVASVVLLLVFAGSTLFVLRGGALGVTTDPEAEVPAWPMWLTLGLLGIAGVGSALVSDWFVSSLRPATQAIGISEGFTGLVIVAIAGNAVENVVGVRFAMQNRMDLALSVILNSSLQVALALIPALVLLSFVVSSTHLLLVMSPLLLVALGLSAVISLAIVYDGESTWVEGVALIGLYVIIAAAFWWA